MFNGSGPSILSSVILPPCTVLVYTVSFHNSPGPAPDQVEGHKAVPLRGEPPDARDDAVSRTTPSVSLLSCTACSAARPKVVGGEYVDERPAPRCGIVSLD